MHRAEMSAPAADFEARDNAGAASLAAWETSALIGVVLGLEFAAFA